MWALPMSEAATPPRLKRPRKKMAAPRSGQVQGGNAQEGPRRYEEELRNAALQQYASQERSNQALKHAID
jgi:hypothetical protein